MSKCGGVFGVARSVFDHALFQEEAGYSRLKAWLWILSEAKYRAGIYKTHAGEIHLERGELCHSEAFMAEAWGWNKSKVHRYLNLLVGNGMIERTAKRHGAGSNRINNRTGFQVLFVCNYSKFQVVALPNRTGKETEVGAQSEPDEPATEPATEPLEIKNEPCDVRVCGGGAERNRTGYRTGYRT